MIEPDKDRKYKMGIGRLSRFIDRYLDDTDWYLIATCCGVTDILTEHERVTRAQTFGDPDYPTAISRFLIDVFDNDEKIGLLLIKEIISQKTLDENAKMELNEILIYFNNENISISDYTYLFQMFEFEKYISLPNYPDNFYKKLIEEINFQYRTNHPISLSILIRKIIENLIIDILRKKYGTLNMNPYYNISKHRFHDFSVLLENLDSCKHELKHVSSNLNDDLIKSIKKYKEFGNSAAHSLDVNPTNDYFSSNKKEINYIIDILIRTYNNLSSG